MSVLGTHGGTGALARVDARVKLLSALGLLALVISCRGVAFPLMVMAMAALMMAWLGIRPRAALIRMSEPLFIAAMLICLKFFLSGSEVMFSVHVFGVRIAGHSDGLRDGLLIAARMMAAVSVVSVLGFSTPFSDLVAAMAWMRAPRTLIEVLAYAYRYIFVLLEDALVIYSAQRNRLGYTSLRGGLRSFGILAGSLVLKAFETSQATAAAMVQRGYDGTMPMHKKRAISAAELCGLAAFLAVMGAAWRM